MLKQVAILGLFISIIFPILGVRQDGNADSNNRKKRLFNLLNVVRFPNEACVGSASRNGTCYTAAECESKGGTSGGTCAQAYGICCIFQVGCGVTRNENCTYFVSNGAPAGACKLKICPCNSNICQLRLDFNTFSINGPSTDTASVVKLLNGAVSTLGIPASLSTRCLVDTFQVTNPGGSAPPVICGLNTGDHMYVDASQECNDLNFQIGPATTGANWDIKVTQYSCDFNNLAPPGCTQYFYGNDGTGTVKTFNFDGGLQLANQDQSICVRTERNACSICWYAASAADVSVSGPDAVMQAGLQPNQCCRYGNNGLQTAGYDCIIIPGAMNTALRSRQCGRGAGLVSVKSMGTKSTTICTCQTPFMVRFMSDNYEFTGTNAAGMTRESGTASPDIGFKLSYFERCP